MNVNTSQFNIYTYLFNISKAIEDTHSEDGQIVLLEPGFEIASQAFIKSTGLKWVAGDSKAIAFYNLAKTFNYINFGLEKISTHNLNPTNISNLLRIRSGITNILNWMDKKICSCEENISEEVNTEIEMYKKFHQKIDEIYKECLNVELSKIKTSLLEMQEKDIKDFENLIPDISKKIVDSHSEIQAKIDMKTITIFELTKYMDETTSNLKSIFYFLNNLKKHKYEPRLPALENGFKWSEVDYELAAKFLGEVKEILPCYYDLLNGAKSCLEEANRDSVNLFNELQTLNYSTISKKDKIIKKLLDNCKLLILKCEGKTHQDCALVFYKLSQTMKELERYKDDCDKSQYDLIKVQYKQLKKALPELAVSPYTLNYSEPLELKFNNPLFEGQVEFERPDELTSLRNSYSAYLSTLRQVTAETMWIIRFLEGLPSLEFSKRMFDMKPFG
jgi:hypothetical protein